MCEYEQYVSNEHNERSQSFTQKYVKSNSLDNSKWLLEKNCQHKLTQIDLTKLQSRHYLSPMRNLLDGKDCRMSDN